MTPSPAAFRNTKRFDPALRRICTAIGRLAGQLAGATNAVLINANAVKLNVGGIERGGTLLVIRFPAAAITREEAPLQELLTDSQPPITYHVHAQGETLDGQRPAYALNARAPATDETADPGGGRT